MEEFFGWNPNAIAGIPMKKIKLTGNLHQLTAVKADTIPRGLADCPWPHPDSHCSSAIYELDPWGWTTLWVWGQEGGDQTKDRFYAQELYADGGQIKRFFCMMKKFITETPPAGHGLWIGLVNQDTLNNMDKLYNPTEHWWAYAYLEDLPTENQMYYFCGDIGADYGPGPIYLVFVTNAESGTWGCGAVNAPVSPLKLWTWHLNDGGYPDGWSDEADAYFDIMGVIYTTPAGAVVEPDTHIENPNFPGTAQEGVPYEFSFTQKNPNAFPCGCPVTLYFDIVDRDSGDPIGEKNIYELICGYGGIDWVGSLTFTGGTFHGRLRVGHYAGGEWPVDDTYDFDVVVTGYPCSHWTNSTDCEAHNCWWWNGSCHDDQPTACSQLNNQSDCERWSCYWYNGACHSSPPSCSYYTDKTTCEAHYCWWWNSSCHDDQPTQCSQLNNQPDCERWGCYWYNGSCHSTPAQPEICDWIDAQGGPAWLDITDVFSIIDSYVYNTPPSGYTFIPTIQNVFGVIDYYLGFDGDAKTGCDYF